MTQSDAVGRHEKLAGELAQANKMIQDTHKSKQEVLARAGLVLSFFIFMLVAVAAFSTDASGFVILVLSVCSVLSLWAAIFASQKVALVLGRFFPLG